MRRNFALTLCAVFVSSVSVARADIVTALSSSVAVAGGYDYTYNVELSGFTFTYDNSDKPAFLTSAPDSATVANIRFTYDGSVIVPPGDLGTFTVESPYGTVNRGGYYDGQSYKVSNDSLQGNVGQLSIPDTTAVTPEPSSLVLLGTGILGMAGIVRRRIG